MRLKPLATPAMRRVLDARSREQRLREPDPGVAGIRRAEELRGARQVVAVVVPVVEDVDLTARRKCFADARLEGARFLRQHGGGNCVRPASLVEGTAEAAQKRVILIRGVPPPEHRCVELSVEVGKGRFHAASTEQHSRLLNRRIVDRGDVVRVDECRAAEAERTGGAPAADATANHLAVGERAVQRLGQRHLPDFVVTVISDGTRLIAVEDGRHVPFGAGGIVDLRLLVFVVLERRLAEVSDCRLLRRRAARDACREKAQADCAASPPPCLIPTHGSPRRPGVAIRPATPNGDTDASIGAAVGIVIGGRIRISSLSTLKWTVPRRRKRLSRTVPATIRMAYGSRPKHAVTRNAQEPSRGSRAS